MHKLILVYGETYFIFLSPMSAFGEFYLNNPSILLVNTLSCCCWFIVLAIFVNLIFPFCSYLSYSYCSSFYGLETLIDMDYSTVLRIVYDNALVH